MNRRLISSLLVALAGAGWAKWNGRSNSPSRLADVAESTAADDFLPSCRPARACEPPEAYKGPIERPQPVGWVFGRMVGVNPKLMSPFKPAGP